MSWVEPVPHSPEGLALAEARVRARVAAGGSAVPKNSHEQDILARYSTPGLRSNTLTRAQKREHLADYYKMRGEQARLVLDRMYGPEQPAAEARPIESGTKPAPEPQPPAQPPSAPLDGEVIPPGQAPKQRIPGQSSGFVRRSVVVTDPKTVEDKKQPVGFLHDRLPKLSGNVCQQCGSAQLVRTGKCETCQSCGWNEGCG